MEDLFHGGAGVLGRASWWLNNPSAPAWGGLTYLSCAERTCVGFSTRGSELAASTPSFFSLAASTYVLPSPDASV